MVDSCYNFTEREDAVQTEEFLHCSTTILLNYKTRVMRILWKKLRIIFGDILVHEIYLENDTLLVKLRKVNNIFTMTMLHCVWRRLFLALGPSSTWISFLESLNVGNCRGRKPRNQNSNVRRPERKDCGTISCRIPVPWDLHFWTNYHNFVGRGKAEGQITWSNLILRTSATVQAQA